MKITDTGFKATMTAVGTGASNADTVVLFQ